MNKRINIRNLIIAMLCITVIFMGIGYAVLSMKLNEKEQEKDIFNVAFTKVEALTPVKGGKQSPIGTNSITSRGTNLNMNFTMYSPLDELSYDIIIKNKGTIRAEILNVLETPDYVNDATASQKIAPVTIVHNDVIGKILEPNEKTTMRITVYYNQTTITGQKNISYQLSLISTSAN